MSQHDWEREMLEREREAADRRVLRWLYLVLLLAAASHVALDLHVWR